MLKRGIPAKGNRFYSIVHSLLAIHVVLLAISYRLNGQNKWPGSAEKFETPIVVNQVFTIHAAKCRFFSTAYRLNGQNEWPWLHEYFATSQTVIRVMAWVLFIGGLDLEFSLIAPVNGGNENSIEFFFPNATCLRDS